MDEGRRAADILTPSSSAAPVRRADPMSSALIPEGTNPRILCIAKHAEEMIGGMLLPSTLAVNSALEGLALLRAQDFDVVLASVPLSDCPEAAEYGLHPAILLEELQRAQPGTPVVLHAPLATAT